MALSNKPMRRTALIQTWGVGAIVPFPHDESLMIAGLDACITAFKILYVSTVFVDEEYRRKGVGARMIREMEKRALAMGVNTVRLDTFNWQGKEFYEALDYRCVGQYDNAEDGYSEYFFLKRLH